MTTSPRRPRTLRHLLHDELQRHGIDLGRAYTHDWSGCQVLALPMPHTAAEIWISDHDARIEEPLADYTGLTAHLEPHGDGGDPVVSVELYGSASRDPQADVRRLLGVLAPLLAARTVADLLLALLDQAGISTGIQVREGRIEGIPVDLPGSGGHLFVTDTTGTRITRPVDEHTGLLVLRYDGEDLLSGDVLYDSQRTDTVADALAAVASIAAVTTVATHIHQGTTR